MKKLRRISVRKLKLQKIFRPSLKAIGVLSIAMLALLSFISLYGREARAETTYTFSGILKDQNNIALRKIDIILRDSQNNTFTDETGADGSFSVAVNPGVYSLKLVNDTWLSGPGRIVKFSIAQPTSNPSIDLTNSNITQNLTLPLGVIQFTTYNEQGYPTGNAMVSSNANSSNTTPVSLYPGSPDAIHEITSSSGSISPDSYGSGQFKAITGTTFTPGSMYIDWSGNRPSSYNTVPVTAMNSTSYIDLPNTPPAPNTFSGIFKDSTGAPVKNATISLRDAYNNIVSSTTSSSGQFSVTVQPGYYSLRAGGNNIPGLGRFYLTQNISNPTIDLATSDITQDLTLPVGIVNFVAYDSLGNIDTYANIQAKGVGTTPIHLYPKGPELNFDGSANAEEANANHMGIGMFKAITGVRYEGTDRQHGVCVEALSYMPVICNTTPLVVGTNDIIVGPQP